MSNPSITTLKIKNFGCIGSTGVSIDIDKIVVLVGANNAGKSTILRAFEVVTDCLKLDQDDFHNREIIADQLPEIELHSIANAENKPGDEWCAPTVDGSFLIKEKWTWDAVGAEPKRVGFNVNKDDWAQQADKEKMPWGVNNVAKSRRPKPHRVNTFDDPEIQAKAITSLFKSLLEDQIKNLKHKEDDELSRYEFILESLKSLRLDSKNMQKTGIKEIEAQANLILERIFPSYGLSITAPESIAPISIELLGDEFSVEMGVKDGISLPLQKQGSGTRRTALWTILKLLADKGMKAKPAGKTAKSFHEGLGPNTAHILLLDEPEVSLHPRATQNARDVLYALPENDNWQIMITTHSPSFIDLTKDHTTIIRVEKNIGDEIKATTLYRPEIAKLDVDDKENLKLLNLFDSHISEAFFGGKVLIVEGDTEYSAFNHIKNEEEKNGNFQYNDLNIIRARGKVTVASMMKVLNHFDSKYFVLHDTDSPLTKSKRKDKEKSTKDITIYKEIIIKNPAWTNNEKILSQMSEKSRVIASIMNFEEAYFSEIIESDKPENCIEHLKNEKDSYDKIKQLLDSILNINNALLPDGAISWSDMTELKGHIDIWQGKIKIEAI